MKKNLPKGLVWLIAIFSAVVLGFIDWGTGHELNFFVFYFIPVSIAAWHIGLGASLWIGILCAITWFTADILSGHVHSLYFYHVWNTVIRLIAFIAIGGTLSKIRLLLDEQRKLFADLKRSEMKFRTLYDSTGDAVVLLNEAGVLDCNKAALMMYGCNTREEFFSINPADLSPPTQPGGKDSMELRDAHIATAFEKGKLQFEWLQKRTDTGEIFPVDVLLTAMELDGKPVLQAVLRDITIRKKTEEALRNSEAKFREIYETIDDVYFDMDPKGNITNVSPSVYRLTGWNEKDLIGKLDTTVYVNPEDEKWLRQKIIKDGFVNDYEILIKRKDGNVCYASLTARRFLNENGQSLGIRGMLRNITERKQVEQEREKLIIELQHALKEVKTLSGMLPICSSCKKIRDDKGYWNQIETYIGEHSDAQFSHGICPDCMKRLYPDIYKKMQMDHESKPG